VVPDHLFAGVAVQQADGTQKRPWASMQSKPSGAPAAQGYINDKGKVRTSCAVPSRTATLVAAA
jgi:hypothetical protein